MLVKMATRVRDSAVSTSGEGLRPGSHHYRASVGYPERYDLVAAMQFNLLTACGLRDYHYVLDIGCGSLRVGRLLIPFLLPGRYHGIEPEQWLIDDGFHFELGADAAAIKKPRFSNSTDFTLTEFGVVFDYIMAQSIFSHATPDQIRTCLREAARCLAADGLLIASFVLGPTDYAGREWVYPECVEYTEEGMQTLAREAGLELQIIDWPHPNAQTWALLHHPGIACPADPTYILAPPRVNRITHSRGAPETLTGFLDGVWDIGPSVLAYGWAVDPRTGEPPSHVLFVAPDGQVITSARVDIERPDVADVFGPALRRSGFRARIPKAALKGVTDVSCYGYSRVPGTAFPLGGSFPPLDCLHHDQLPRKTI